MKQITNLLKQPLTIKRVWIYFFVLFIFSISIAQLRPAILPNLVRSSSVDFYEFMDFGFALIFFVLLAAFAEELFFRFMLTKRGFFHAVWITLMIALFYLVFFVFPVEVKFPPLFIPMFGVIIAGLLVFSRFKLFTDKYLKYLYNPSKYSSLLSIIVFISLHFSNSSNWTDYWFVFIVFQLLIHLPKTILYTIVRLDPKFGFKWALGLHFTNNILAISLIQLFPWL